MVSLGSSAGSPSACSFLGGRHRFLCRGGVERYGEESEGLFSDGVEREDAVELSTGWESIIMTMFSVRQRQMIFQILVGEWSL